jgi:hypothetical protein
VMKMQPMTIPVTINPANKKKSVGSMMNRINAPAFSIR